MSLTSASAALLGAWLGAAVSDAPEPATTLPGAFGLADRDANCPAHRPNCNETGRGRGGGGRGGGGRGRGGGGGQGGGGQGEGA